MIKTIEESNEYIIFNNNTVMLTNVEKAYRDISDHINGISAVFEGIFKGKYSLSEAIIASAIFDKGGDGYYIQEDKMERGKYICLNGIDFVFLSRTYKLLVNKDFKDSDFFADNGTGFHLRGKNDKGIEEVYIFKWN